MLKYLNRNCILVSALILFFMNLSSSNKFCGVYKVRLPLNGGPRFLKLHHAIIFENLGESASDRFFQLDFLPIDPENPMILLELMRGGMVQGEIRLKQCCWPNEASIVESRIREHVSPFVFSKSNFVQNYNKMLSLSENNCVNFADAALAEINELSSSSD